MIILKAAVSLIFWLPIYVSEGRLNINNTFQYTTIQLTAPQTNYNFQNDH